MEGGGFYQLTPEEMQGLATAVIKLLVICGAFKLVRVAFR